MKNSFDFTKSYPDKKNISKTVKALCTIVGGYTLILLMDYSGHNQYKSSLCIFKLATGIPCAGCGMGRASLAFLKGNFIESFSYNIVCIPFSICILISIFWLSYDLLRGRDTFFKTINRKIPFYYLIPFFILTAISWIVNISRGI